MSTQVEYRLLPDPRYRVGSDGSVWSRAIRGARDKSVYAKEWRRVVCVPVSHGHLIVKLGSGSKRRYVHHLILEAFVGQRPEGMQCRHINGDPADNRLENLAWGTHQENMDDRMRHGGYGCGESAPNVSMTEAQAKEALRLKGTMTWKQIARHVGASYDAVANLLRGKTWRHLTRQAG